MFRLCWFVAAVLAAWVMGGCSKQDDAPNDASPEPDAAKATKNSGTAKPGPRTETIEGYYVLDDPAFYGAMSMADVPRGQVFHLAARDGRWMMINMMSGWGGTYLETESGAVFTTTEGPAGATDKKEETTVTTTSKGITLAMPDGKGGGMSIELAWESDAIPEEFDFDSFLGKKKK